MKMANNKEKIKISKKNLVTVIIFLFLIGIFTAASLIKKDTGFSETENRVLTEKPQFSAESLFNGSYTSKYQEYVRDQFPFRNTFVALRNYCEAMIGKKEINNVLLAKDDYYIEDHSRENYESEIADTNLNALKSFCSRYEKSLGDSHVSAMIVPTAQSVLTNKFKTGMYAYNQNEYLTKIKEAVGENIYIDTYSMLKEHNTENIYYRTDHHWTTYGAYLAYNCWAKQKNIDGYSLEAIDKKEVSKEFYGTINSKLNMKMKADTILQYTVKNVDFTVDYNMGANVTDTFFFKEYLQEKDKYSYFLGGNPGLVDITSTNKNNRKLLIIKDSYANCITPVYAANFEKTYVVDLRFFNMSIDGFVEENQITDILVLYNVDSFATDKYVKRIK